MNSLLTDWCSFCEGDRRFEESDFFDLVKVHNSREEILLILQYFEHSHEMASRLLKVMSFGSLKKSIYLLPTKKASPNEVLSVGKKWLKELQFFCERSSESSLKCVCDIQKVRYVPSDEFEVLSMSGDVGRMLREALIDSVIFNSIPRDKYVYALLEVFYMVAADYYLSWYIATPILSTQVRFENYFDFWSVGGLISICEDSVFITASG